MAKMNSLNVHFEEFARISTFLGLVRLSELRVKYPGVQDAELIRVGAAGTAGQAAVDLTAAAKLIDVLQFSQLKEDSQSMRVFLSKLLDYDTPPWAMAVVRGRGTLQSLMPPAVIQCFSLAKLFDLEPDIDAVLWWDRLADAQRVYENKKLKDIGRKGERLTIAYETKRLVELGIKDKPRWVSLDDEWLGYDILSFDIMPDGTIANRLIEVKACSGLPLRIFLTRNEWDRALQAKDAHRFHVWYLPAEKLFELNWEHLSAHIPEDKGNGHWREISIQLKSSVEISGV